MRALVFLALFACEPKVDPQHPSPDVDVDLEGKPTAPAAAAPVVAERPVAAPGKGLRTGTIERARLLAVLDSGPGNFLRQFEVTRRMDGSRFVGWQLVQLIDRTGPLGDIDVAPGDVLLAVNGKPISRPDELQTLWDSLRTASSLDAELWRGDAKLHLSFAIEPATSSK